MVYRIYTLTEGIPAALVSEIFSCTDTYTRMNQPEEADFFAYPTHYQVAYDYAPADFAQHGVNADVQPLIQQRFAELDTLAGRYGKKIIAVYIRDNAQPLPAPHAIVFRTSLTASGRQRNEFAFPANGRPLLTGDTGLPAYIEWSPTPSVGFRGQSAPMQLPLSMAIRNRCNLLAQQWGWKQPFSFRYNFGYLHRRNALFYLHQAAGIVLDYRTTTTADIFADNSRTAYVEGLLRNPYSLCVSGHGNYSSRLYETMAAGRIPLFVNTDCVLPLEEMIDYKSLYVWVEANALHRIATVLRNYHTLHEGPSLLKKQQQIQQVWQQYFAADQYYRHIPYYLRHFTS